ncbi:ferredoxin-type protein NapF [Photobacterium sanctipauli]|uniref:Ferredoxin-type protein NapF n=1 Tax=Photobacterium sanctipauli TaxID=1342794 RepID=A0A2T3NTR5_9GAMM|nr:ferredoxin-type protein NapF [Photobacterium sanctipauli]PSW19595.1 ferredoxin-type protein NapF [Photobacterium sanctipauli]
MFDRSRRRLLTRRRPVLQRMPWVVEEDTFVDKCTRCNKCINACETQIITKGDGGFPVVDFDRGECTFCYRCADICPELLFHPQAEQPWQQVAQINEGCLALSNIECRSCGDMCEMQAITFKLQPGGVAKPNLETDSCTGCGACISVCPTSAITMVTNNNEEN